MPTAMVQRVLESAPNDVILVGGQALAYWVAWYDIDYAEWKTPAISRDVDFFTPDASNSAPLSALARAIGGQAHVQRMQSLTALVGSAMAPAGDGRVYNVDLIHSVFGMPRERVSANAMKVDLPGGGTLRVMHPLDVLRSRSENLHALAEKRDEAGQQQFRLAIEMARAYLEDRIDALEAGANATEAQRDVLKLLRPVVDASSGDAAIKNAERYGIHLADAIPAWRIRAPAFWDKQWPHLRLRMSPGYAVPCEQRRSP